jgi:hypothetical protein
MKTTILTFAFAAIMVSCGNNETAPTVDTAKAVDTVKPVIDTVKCDTACKDTVPCGE